MWMKVATHSVRRVILKTCCFVGSVFWTNKLLPTPRRLLIFLVSAVLTGQLSAPRGRWQSTTTITKKDRREFPLWSTPKTETAKYSVRRRKLQTIPHLCEPRLPQRNAAPERRGRRRLRSAWRVRSLHQRLVPFANDNLREKKKKVVKTMTSERGITFSLSVLRRIKEREVKVSLVLLLWKVWKKDSVCASQLCVSQKLSRRKATISLLFSFSLTIPCVFGRRLAPENVANNSYYGHMLFSVPQRDQYYNFMKLCLFWLIKFSGALKCRSVTHRVTVGEFRRHRTGHGPTKLQQGHVKSIFNKNVFIFWDVLDLYTDTCLVFISFSQVK